LALLLHLTKESSLAILSRTISFKKLHGGAKLLGPESKASLWDTSLSSFVDRYQYFREICSFLLQDRKETDKKANLSCSVHTIKAHRVSISRTPFSAKLSFMPWPSHTHREQPTVSFE
jgi:hypothetical protein